MMRVVGLLVAGLFLAGCRAPTPSFNVLAPWGSETVPPPPTGSVGTSADYYAPPTPPPATSGGGSAAPNAGSPSGSNRSSSPSGSSSATGAQLQTGSPPRTFMGTENTFTASSGGVVPAAYTWNDAVSPKVAQASRSTSVSSPLPLHGMPVNDATMAEGPNAPSNGTPVNLSQLPDASHIASSVRTITPGASNAARGGAASTHSRSATASRDAWQPR